MTRLLLFALPAALIGLAGCGTVTADDARVAAASPSPTVVVTAAPSVVATPEPSASATTPAPTFPDGVTAIDCDPSHARADAVTVLGADEYRVGGWSHVNGVGSFGSVALAPSAYRISAENYVEDPSCGGTRTLNVVLAKKLYDWDRQHANGIESTFPGADLRFGDVTDIVLELRLDPARTTLPDATALTESFGELLTPEQVAQLDQGKVNLELTLFGEGASGNRPFMNASVLIEVDPAQVTDGWVRVQVPREQLSWYTEEAYVRTPVGADENQDLVVAGLRINPESAGGLTVRHLVGDAFDPAAYDEVFKEMAMSIVLIEVGRS